MKRLTAKESNAICKECCSQSRVIPVLSLNDIDDAIPLANALIEGGLNVIEVTLRTPNALSIVKEISKLMTFLQKNF